MAQAQIDYVNSLEGMSEDPDSWLETQVRNWFFYYLDLLLILYQSMGVVFNMILKIKTTTMS